MRTLKLTLAYDGTGLVGFQRQPSGTSVQGLLEEALSRIEGAPVQVTGAGRTDAGVHATGQVASVTLHSRIEEPALRRALNAVLPPEVRVLGVCPASAGFHARFTATGKTYEYRILNGPVVPPFLARFTWHVRYRLDLDAMREAAGALAGEHDFAGFQSAGSPVRSTVRRVQASTLLDMPVAALGSPGLPNALRLEGRLIVYSISGSGFLRHMVRAIAGTLVEVGSGRAEPALITRLLRGAGRSSAGPTAPACGLCLAAVHYPEEPA